MQSAKLFTFSWKGLSFQTPSCHRSHKRLLHVYNILSKLGTAGENRNTVLNEPAIQAKKTMNLLPIEICQASLVILHVVSYCWRSWDSLADSPTLLRTIFLGSQTYIHIRDAEIGLWSDIRKETTNCTRWKCRGTIYLLNYGVFFFLQRKCYPLTSCI